MNPPSHPIVLCVDDFALHPLIDQAVLQLASKGRISATSCMSTAPRWRTAAHDLKPLRPHLAVGLHFNLTESHGGLYHALTLKQAIAQAYLGRWRAAQWQAVWREQLDAFEAAMGTAPDFIDGHQHVHQLPGVRQALLAEITARYAAHERPWLRSTVPAGRLWSSAKALIIATLGGYSATRLWRTAHLATNHGFAGVYGFDAPTPAAYRVHMQSWLRQVQPGSLLMCHPAAGVVQGDAIGTQRPKECAYLLSDEFVEDLQRFGRHIHQGGRLPEDNGSPKGGELH